MPPRPSIIPTSVRSMGDTWYLDEFFVIIRGQRQYLWRAVDQDGDVIDILVQSRRDRHAAARFFRKLLKGQGRGPRHLITDKLGSYAAAHRTVMPGVIHSTRQYENNRAGVSHQRSEQGIGMSRGAGAQVETTAKHHERRVKIPPAAVLSPRGFHTLVFRTSRTYTAGLGVAAAS